MTSPRTGLDENRWTSTFVTPAYKHMHMPRREFLRLLNFKGFQCCHICGRRSYLLVDHDHRTHLMGCSVIAAIGLWAGMSTGYSFPTRLG